MHSLRDYAIITGTYWVFTLTDGALRMLILLHLHQTGSTPLQIASLFLFYEFFGVLTNLFGGWLGARHGLKSTLVSGLTLQILGCAMLAIWASALTIPLLMVAQSMAGVAKDLTKMSSKSYLKLLVPEGQHSRLFRWVALLTGSKNTLKGAGFFLGGWLLVVSGFQGACLWMIAGLAVSLAAAALLLPPSPGKSASRVRFGHLVSQDRRVNWLSGARFFLFGARDIWFVLALPIFLSSSLGWSHPQVGGFLALWVIGYGFVQAAAPLILRRQATGPTAAGPLSQWTASLALPLAGIYVGLELGGPPELVLVVGAIVFGALFAVTSALHSYLIVAYSDADQVSLAVGFYYMANAAGRLVGTALSGALFQWVGQGERGLQACCLGSILFVLASGFLCRGLGERPPLVASQP